MSIKFVEGDMFEKEYNIRVNTVNCVGVMGKGLALRFKRRFPDNFQQYYQCCRLGLLKPGELFYTFNGVEGMIINFATKDHWKNPSNFEWIRSGVSQLIEVFYRVPKGTTVALPALGCTNGGLAWPGVRDYLKKRLQYNTENVKVDIYAPLL